MKCYKWLWGALIGAVVLPVLTLLAGGSVLYASHFNFGRSPFYGLWEAVVFPFACYRAIFGCISGGLCQKQRSMHWRIAASTYGLGSVLFVLYRTHALVEAGLSPFSNTFSFAFRIGHLPMLSWGFALIFFALLLKSPPFLRSTS